MSANPETAVSYAALILVDGGLDVTADKLQTLLNAASVDIQPIWSTILARALEGKDVKQILTAVQVSDPVDAGKCGKEGGMDGSQDDGSGDQLDASDGESEWGCGLIFFD